MENKADNPSTNIGIPEDMEGGIGIGLSDITKNGERDFSSNQIEREQPLYGNSGKIIVKKFRLRKP